MSEIENKVSELRNTLRSDRLDMSFGEIMNIYEDGDLIVSPEYQRAFRWNIQQRSDFIESILLGVPIPPIFVAEDEDGKWELVDGLQRISTILSFFGILKGLSIEKEKECRKLTSGELTEDVLNNKTVESLPLKMKLTIKRAVCRVEILRWDSNFNMKYHLFKRLNTSSSPLSVQEVRNCIFLGDFNNLLKELSENEHFQELIPINQNLKDEMYLVELVLRFLAFKHEYKNLKIKHSMEDFLDSFMEEIYLGKKIINISEEKENFEKILKFLKNNFDANIFKARNHQFSENLYDSILFIANKFYNKYDNNNQLFIDNVSILKDDKDYREFSGHRTYLLSRMRKKIDRTIEIFDVS
ncbi:MAG: DUF262 domain-containing protein [Sulfurovum sp.]